MKVTHAVSIHWNGQHIPLLSVTARFLHHEKQKIDFMGRFSVVSKPFWSYSHRIALLYGIYLYVSQPLSDDIHTWRKMGAEDVGQSILEIIINNLLLASNENACPFNSNKNHNNTSLFVTIKHLADPPSGYQRSISKYKGVPQRPKAQRLLARQTNM